MNWKHIIISMVVLILGTGLVFSLQSKKEVFSAPVEEGKALVRIGDKLFDMKAKYSITGVLLLQGGSFSTSDFTSLTMGIPAGFGAGSYNNNRDHYVKEKFMMVSGNRQGDLFGYDPDRVFDIKVSLKGELYEIMFDGGFLFAGKPIACYGKIVIARSKIAQ